MATQTLKTDRNALLSKLSLAGNAVSSKELIPCFVNFLFTGTDIIAYDNTKGVRVQFETPFTGMVPGSLLTGLLSACSSEIVALTAKGDELTITAGRSKMNLPLLPEEGFLFEFPTVTNKFQTVDLDDGFLAALQLCLVSTMAEPAAQQFTGVTVKHNDVDGGLTLYSTDNISITQISLLDHKVPSDHVPDYVLPGEFCKLVLLADNMIGGVPVEQGEGKEGNPQSTPKLRFGKDFVVATFGNGCQVCTRLFEDDGNINFEAAVAQTVDLDNLSVSDIPEEFDQALTRSSIIAASSQAPCTITTTKKAMTLYTTSQIGEVKDALPFVGHDTVKADFDPDKIKRVLDVTNGIHITDRCVILTGGTEERRYYHFLSTVAGVASQD